MKYKESAISNQSIRQRPKVGIGVMIFKEGKVLMGKRMNAHGEGEYSFTGGYLEHGETFEECAIRETREEAGIEIQNVRFLCVGNIRKYGKHHVGIGLLADWKSGEATNMEPDKREGWDWYDPAEHPEPLFDFSGKMLFSLRSRQLCHDKEEQTEVEYQKLVRDKILDFIRKDNRKPVFHIADDREYEEQLLRKLKEEAEELSESCELKEIADVLEIVESLCELRGWSTEEVRRAKEKRAEERGGFRERIILEKAS